MRGCLLCLFISRQSVEDDEVHSESKVYEASSLLAFLIGFRSSHEVTHNIDLHF